jgi:hypothetical protein
LVVLKDDLTREPAKQREVEKILGPVGSDAFNKLVNFGKAINDFTVGGAGGDKVRQGCSLRELVMHNITV